ncbi:MAG: DUF3494 domain-containing protein [Deltaproteobacteria bacterium]|nr:DUF3494 domain-containing protein [Deltaproteobacteria bacterium]
MSSKLAVSALLFGGLLGVGCVTEGELDDQSSAEQEVLGPPSGLTLTPTATDRITVSWNAVPGALKYYVYQATAAAGPYSFRGTARAPATSLPVANLTPNTNYCFEVRTDDGTGPGAFSAPACSQGQSIAPAPTQVTATTSLTYATTVNVRWGAVSGASKYYVYRLDAATGTFTFYATSLTTAFDATHLTAGATYCFRIAAQTTPGITAQSATACNSSASGGVNLGAAGSFAILSKSGISTVPNSAITGDLGVSPSAASTITGFSLTADATNVFSTSTQVTGRVYAANYAPPTPANLTTSVGDMQLAFTDAASRAPNVTELGAGNIGGMNLAPGVYKWGTGLLIPTSVTLTGSATAVWIFQIAQDLTMSSGAQITLAGGALAKNIYWQVGAQTTLNTTAHLEGNVLSKTAITLAPGTSVNGRLLAQTAVTLNTSTIVKPAP